MKSALLIALKDLKVRVRDKSAYLWGLVAPLVLAVIFGNVFAAADSQTFAVEFAIADEDGGAISEAFLGWLDGMEDRGVAYHLVESEDEALSQVEAGSQMNPPEGEEVADAAFVLPEGLSESVQSGEGGTIEVIGGKGKEFAAQLAYAFADAFATEVQAVEVAVRAAIEMDPTLAADVESLADRAAATPNPIGVNDVSASVRLLSNKTYMVAGMAVFFVFFTVQFGVTGLLEEKRHGTMQRLIAAPIPRDSLIIGKMLVSFVLGVVSLAILAVVTTPLLGADWGPPLGVAALIAAVSFAAMGILAVVASLARTAEQASNFQTALALILGLLGGTFFPVSQIGGVLEVAGRFTPHFWFLRGLSDMASGDVSAIWPSVGALLAFGLVTGVLSWPGLRKAVAR
ncbi:MAG: hypothetical protein Kow0056_12980 [Coriobacteriia bacterium]